MREGPYRYENEGSEHRALGSVAVSAGAWWSVMLSVPADEVEAREGTVVVRCQRHGEARAGYRGDGLVELVLPRSEIGAVVTLLSGAAEQARRDGLLPRDG